MLLEDARRRFVRNADELATLVEEALRDMSDEMTRTGQLLWDQWKTKRGMPHEWVPKKEAALAAYVANELTLRLHGRGLAIHREVLIKPTDPYGAGDRTDILVEATVASDSLVPMLPIRVVIEVKCPWNSGLLTDQRGQLAARYLPEAQAGSGIYAVGWFPPELWFEGDYRKDNLAKPTAQELSDILSEQASEICKTGISVRTIVLVIPRPA